MALTTPSMGLRRWDQPNDIFSYTELSANWALVDSHDHTSGKGVQIPTGGLANLAVDTSKLANSAVTDAKIATGIGGAKLTNATVDDGKLASPNSGVWRTIHEATSVMTAGLVGSAGAYWLDTTGGIIQRSGVAGLSAPTFWYPNALSDYAVAGKTTQVRVVSHILTNGTAAGVSVTSALYPSVSHAFTSNNVALTLGTAYSTASFGTPATTVGLTSVGSAIALSSLPANFYVHGVAFGGAVAAGTVITFSNRIEMRHV